MPALVFTVFVDKVADGTKSQTIRPHRKRPIRVGDTLYLSKWDGAPYRSKRTPLGVGICTETMPIEIDEDRRAFLDGTCFGHYTANELARLDGFTCAAKMLNWFEATHGLPFSGDVIRWRLTDAT